MPLSQKAEAPELNSVKYVIEKFEQRAVAY